MYLLFHEPLELTCHSKEVLVKGGMTTLHNNRNCININIYNMS
jgi:hypothetical protein